MTTDNLQLWFDALTKDRIENADMLEKPSMRGIQRSVVDKYSDQAHFVYELLQNADDVKATSARFRLEKNGLFFVHDGSVRFTVSNPKTEELDSNAGSLGHVNAITSIANSNKTTASIGKFGVGFKAVFQYTQTPHIYDPGVRFKIERFIVPHLLGEDVDWRESSETVFWFPFNSNQKSAEESFQDVILKLKALDHPVLFLSHLKRVSFTAAGVTGSYTKVVEDSAQHGDIVVERHVLTLQVNEVVSVERFLVFTRTGHSGLPYCVAYATDTDGRLTAVDRPAFCFFPTKEVTGLKFLVHGPFLLTDSREGIKASAEHNRELVQMLARLAADSLPLLRDGGLVDDRLFDLIPYDESQFPPLDDRNKLSFMPFYTAVKRRLKTDALMPAADGECLDRDRSFWASDTALVELFSDLQLAQLTGKDGARWIFRSRGKKEVQSTNKTLADYIDGRDARTARLRMSNLIASALDPESLLNKITPDFISAQPLEWLHELYSYLSERASYQKTVLEKPIFLDQEGRPAPAFDSQKQLVLFLPSDEVDGYATVHRDLLVNKSSREFIEKFGIKKPSLKDEIYNKILPAFTSDRGFDSTPHFKKFFQYFKVCPQAEIQSYIGLLRGNAILRYTKAADSKVFRGTPESMYFPTQELKFWFEPKPDTRFLALDVYRALVDEEEHNLLDSFFQLLGVNSRPRVRGITSSSRPDGQPLNRKGYNHHFEDRFLDGCEQLISAINQERSAVLWRGLTILPELGALNGRHTWTFHGSKNEPFVSSEEARLRSSKWLLTNSGEFVDASSVTTQSLARDYDTTSPGARALISFLGIREEARVASNLSEDEARKIKLLERLIQTGLTEEELLRAAEDAARRKTTPTSTGAEDNGASSVSESPLIRDINSRRPSVKQVPAPDQTQRTGAPSANEEVRDSDDFTPKAEDYERKLERAKDRQASELDRLEREQVLHDKSNALPRYSYGWFLALLELECMTSAEKTSDAKTISIRFGKAERDVLSTRTIVLKEPSRFIPQSIEEFSGVRIDLDFGNGQTGHLRVESFTAKEFALLGRLESADELSGIDLARVVEARLEVRNPSFLLQELLERFRELNFDEGFDMKANLPADIEFVFGPPGTGKTTHLAENVLIPKMMGRSEAKILVLTPTNKAADVLTLRIVQKMGADTSYLNWLIRFGTSADERIEKAGVWRDRSFDFGALGRSVTVTTIARFAYDGFSGQRAKKLAEIEWDAIVIDEASMISLASIVHPLYSRKPEKFIISGDPFQIEPIVAVDQWKDENIYSLVGLNRAGSFANPETEPHDYTVKNLDVQYRSIPAIGEVFSRFTYDGILKHHRSTADQRVLSLKGFVAQPLNLIKFPVSKYESIYRAKRLDTGTSYQTYSALFTFEFVRWLAGQIQSEHANPFRIGVIAPYRAQASFVNRLIDAWETKPESAEVQVGTIHGFQGDECDIVIAVLNPPPKISTDPRMFLNKLNILNVAISRARDYLFIVMPDNDTENVQNLYRIAKLEQLVRAAGGFGESISGSIEELMWGNPRYLEDNTFSTGHQMVNVYRKPERYYEVRSDESAIDVQIHEK